jgi:hypothetical protein
MLNFENYIVCKFHVMCAQSYIFLLLVVPVMSSQC